MEASIALQKDSPVEALKRFIVLSLKTMFRGGASGGQLRDFMENYLPEQPGHYNGNQMSLALSALREDGVLERRGIRWCLSQP